MFVAILKRIGIINLTDRACSVVSRQIRRGANSRGMDPQTPQSSTKQDVHDESYKATQMSERMDTSSPDRKRARTDEMKSEAVLKFSKMSEHAFAPTKGSKQAAGFDLYSAYDYTIEARGKVLAKTDINIALPEGCYGRVAPRSGLAHKHFIDVGAGVIDQDYRGNVGVVMFNFSDKPFEVKKGDRIAQLICERIYTPEIVEIESLDKTDRGAGGFGSTGISLTETNGTQSKEVNGTDSKETNGTDVKETNGIDSKETSGTDSKATNGTDSKETNGTDVKETNGTDSKETNGTDSKETNGSDVKETSGTDSKETSGTDIKETSGTDSKETMETS